MRKNEIKVGGHYVAKVSGNLVTVRVDEIRDRYEGTNLDGKWTTVYDVTNLNTGRKTTFRSAAKFRETVNPEAVEKYGLAGALADKALQEAPPPPHNRRS